MQGKVAAVDVVGHIDGITPAHAGKRSSGSGPAPRSADHPRACGEKWFSVCTPVEPLGSPPHMRGKAQSHGVKNAINRIIPAYAGKRRLEKSPVRVAEDHPRACGEKLPCKQGPASPYWITPAHAGEKLHRVCGLELARGSPPHLRGKVALVDGVVTAGRITPALAGKSCSDSR